MSPEPNFAERRVAVDVVRITRIFETRPEQRKSFRQLPGHRQLAGGAERRMGTEKKQRGDHVLWVNPIPCNRQKAVIEFDQAIHPPLPMMKGGKLILAGSIDK